MILKWIIFLIFINTFCDWKKTLYNNKISTISSINNNYYSKIHIYIIRVHTIKLTRYNFLLEI